MSVKLYEAPGNRPSEAGSLLNTGVTTTEPDVLRVPQS
jgi:hypothetical protein